MVVGPTYHVLDKETLEIRLIKILPSTDPASIVKCQIFKTALNGDTENEPYHALSYVWGDPNHHCPIEVDDVQVSVGVSLEAALRAIRKDNEPITIWADALCINQNEIQERNHQVAIMGLVYSRAQSVVSWLGEASDESDLAIDSIREWALFFRDLPESILSGTAPAVYRHMIDLAVQTVPLAFDARARLAIKNLDLRPYWTRVWIVQEIMLAKYVEARCGSKCIDMRLVKDAMDILILIESIRVVGMCPTELFDPEAVVNFASPEMFAMLKNLERKGPCLPFSDMTLSVDAVAMPYLHATDPRDRIFGLIGRVAPTSGHYELIAPDYNKSLEQVYNDYSRYAIMTGPDLKLLNIAGNLNRPKDAEDSLPSWVADWRDEEACMGSQLYRRAKEEMPMDSTDIIRWSANNKVLKIKGLKIDVIKKVYDRALFPIWRLRKEHGGGSRIQDFAEDFMDPVPVAGGESMLSQYFRLVGIDWQAGEDQKIQTDQEHHFESAARFLKYILVEMQTQQVSLSGSTLGQLTLSTMPFALTSAFLGIDAPLEQKRRLADLIVKMDMDEHPWYESALRLRVDGHLPFVTRGGKMGLGSYNIQEGDSVCQLAKHTLPFVLGVKEDRFVNRGECFVLDLELRELTPEVVPHMEEFEIC